MKYLVLVGGILLLMTILLAINESTSTSGKDGVELKGTDTRFENLNYSSKFAMTEQSSFTSLKNSDELNELGLEKIGKNDDSRLVKDNKYGRTYWKTYAQEKGHEYKILVDANNGKIYEFFNRTLAVDGDVSEGEAEKLALEFAKVFSELPDEYRIISHGYRYIAAKNVNGTLEYYNGRYGFTFREQYKGIDTDNEIYVGVSSSGQLHTYKNMSGLAFKSRYSVKFSAEEATSLAEKAVQSYNFTILENQTSAQFIHQPNYLYGNGHRFGHHVGILCWDILFTDERGNDVTVWIDSSTGKVVGGVGYI